MTTVRIRNPYINIFLQGFAENNYVLLLLLQHAIISLVCLYHFTETNVLSSTYAKRVFFLKKFPGGNYLWLTCTIANLTDQAMQPP